MRNKLWLVVSGFFGLLLILVYMFGFAPNFVSRDYLLSPNVYYELPDGGYIYIEDEYVHYNEDSFSGALEYQITLNYKEVNLED